MTNTQSRAQPVIFTQASGAEAFEQIRAELEAVSKSDPPSPKIDIQLAAAFAHSIALRDLEPARRTKFAQLADAGLWDIHALESLPTAALAAWYCRRQFDQLDAVARDGRIPEQTAQEAAELRLRMLRVLEYHFFEHAEYGPRLAAIRSGHGYQDLANDLQALREIYVDPPALAVIERDLRWYRASDAAQAQELAAAIFLGLGRAREGERRRWFRLSVAAWSVLDARYRAVASAGQFLFVDDEDVQQSYPPLLSAVRTRRRPVRPVDDEDEAPLAPPTSDAGGANGIA